MNLISHSIAKVNGENRRYVIVSLTRNESLIFPNFNKTVNDYWFDSPMAIFEMIVSFWLLFKGLRPVEPIQAQAGAA
jgi:hypothetical protein